MPPQFADIYNHNTCSRAEVNGALLACQNAIFLHCYITQVEMLLIDYSYGTEQTLPHCLNQDQATL